MDIALILEKLGLPVGIIAVLLFALWRGAAWASGRLEWFATEVAKPVVERHLAFVGSLEDTQTKLEKNLQKLAENDTRQTEMLERLAERVESSHDAIANLRQNCPGAEAVRQELRGR